MIPSADNIDNLPATERKTTSAFNGNMFRGIWVSVDAKSDGRLLGIKGPLATDRAINVVAIFGLDVNICHTEGGSQELEVFKNGRSTSCFFQ